MIDNNLLNGASVKDATGRTGRITSVTETHVNVAWMNKGLVVEEKALERTSLPKDLQVLTLKEGWQALRSVAGIKTPSKIDKVCEDLAALVEAKKKPKKLKAKKKPKKLKAQKKFGKKLHSPFKNFSPTGPGPNDSFGTRKVKRKIQWDCSKEGKYRQRCVALKVDPKGVLRKTRQVKHIQIKPGYKKLYNAAYKQWRPKQGW